MAWLMTSAAYRFQRRKHPYALLKSWFTEDRDHTSGIFRISSKMKNSKLQVINGNKHTEWEFILLLEDVRLSTHLHIYMFLFIINPARTDRHDGMNAIPSSIFCLWTIIHQHSQSYTLLIPLYSFITRPPNNTRQRKGVLWGRILWLVMGLQNLLNNSNSG